MRLGWRTPRANTLQGPDAVALKAVFGDLQRFMTWPYVGATLSGTTIDATFTDLTLTAKTAAASPFVAGDPYKLIRSSTSIQVPQDYKTWMVVAATWCRFRDEGAGFYQFGWRYNNTTHSDIASQQRTGAGLPIRFSTPLIMPVKAGDILSVAASASGTASAVENDGGYPSAVWAFFLPLA